MITQVAMSLTVTQTPLVMTRSYSYPKSTIILAKRESGLHAVCVQKLARGVFGI